MLNVIILYLKYKIISLNKNEIKINTKYKKMQYDILADHDIHIDLYNDLGYVKLIDCMPRLCPLGRTLDFMAAKCARTSYASELKTIKEDEQLVNFLVREKHTSPLEFIRLVFLVKCPIFVARQIMRHRTGSYNEQSARYTEMKDEFFLPDTNRKNNQYNKQSSGGTFTKTQDVVILSMYEESYKAAMSSYKKLLSIGVCREQARSVLPVGTFTSFYVTYDMNNFLKFLTLRTAPDCQYETKIVADAMLNLARPLSPVIFKAWDLYYHNVISLNVNEVASIKLKSSELIEGSKGEKNAYKEKCEKLF